MTRHRRMEVKFGIPYIRAEFLTNTERETLAVMSSCYDKQQYGHAESIRVRSRMQQRSGEKFDHYRCRFCGYWHVGHTMKGKEIQ